jgi:hypothetical protein
MRNTLLASGSLVLCYASTVAWAEPLVLPPVWFTGQRVQLLTFHTASGHPRLEIEHMILASNNVQPLLQKADGNVLFTGKQGYYRFAALNELRFSLTRWKLRYAFGVADHFEGDTGAVQLYLGGSNLSQFPASDTVVSATMNRSAVNRWTLEHIIPIHRGQEEGWLLLAGSLYLTRRVQQGMLTGLWQNARFDGNLLLDTTRGLPPSEAHSIGWGMHLAFGLPLSEEWRFAFWGENLLGCVRQRKVQRVTARVLTNTVIPDADGFLHAAPLLSGRIDTLSRELSLQRRVTLGLARRGETGTWLLLASQDAGWEYTVGTASGRHWFLLTLPRREWQVAYRRGQWELVLGLSEIDPARARHGSVQMRWAMPVGR